MSSLAKRKDLTYDFMDEINRKVSTMMGFTEEELKGSVKCRKARIKDARHLVMTTVYEYLKPQDKTSLEAVGSYYSKDHASVLNSIKRIHEYIETEHVWAMRYNELRAWLSDGKILAESYYKESYAISLATLKYRRQKVASRLSMADNMMSPSHNLVRCYDSVIEDIQEEISVINKQYKVA